MTFDEKLGIIIKTHSVQVALIYGMEREPREYKQLENESNLHMFVDIKHAIDEELPKYETESRCDCEWDDGFANGRDSAISEVKKALGIGGSR